MRMRKYTRAELRHIKECRYCREKLSRRKAAGLGAAVATFVESLRAQGSEGYSSEEKRMRLCTGEGCGEGYSAEDSEDWKKCPKCGSKLSEPSFDFVLPERTGYTDERRTDEDEGRSGGLNPRDDSNDYRGSGDRMSRPGHEPTDNAAKDNPKKGRLAEALKTFREGYKGGKAGSKS